jgi:hypothetical protein
MKTRFWNVGVETYVDGTVKAAVLRCREAEYQPMDSYRKEPGREIFSIWFESAEAAEEAVFEALAMNDQKQAAAA